MTDEETPETTWHVIPAETLKRILREVAGGADPEMVYIEHYANAEDHQTENGED